MSFSKDKRTKNIKRKIEKTYKEITRDYRRIEKKELLFKKGG